MELDLTLEIDPLKIPNNQSIVEAKKLYKEWKYLNKCCMMIMRITWMILKFSINYPKDGYCKWAHELDW